MTDYRLLSEIADEIKSDWTRPYYGAIPYLDAMSTLHRMNDFYGVEQADGIVRYFLSNASAWRGDVARRVKAELRSMLP